MDWGLAGSVILSGLVIVFLVLIVLIVLVQITGRAVRGNVSKRDEAPPPVASKPQTAPVAPVHAPVPEIQSGIDDETVAAISAAIYACMDSAAAGTQYVIRSVKRAAGERPVWGFAGMQQNTRPF